MNQSLNEQTTMMRQSFPFDLLSDEQFQRIADRTVKSSFEENEFLFREDEEEIEIHFLISGLAKNILHREDGKDISVRFYYPGDLIGVMILLAGGSMNFSVKALEACDTIKIRREVLLELMGENETFSEVILSNIGDRMKSLYDEIKKERSAGDRENIGLFRTRVNAIMERPLTCRRELALDEAADLLASHHAAGLIVTNRRGQIEGVLTQQRVIRGLLHGARSEEVARWMDDQPVTIQEDAFSYEVLTFFKDDYVDIVPVMRGETPAGMLTAESFLQLQDSHYLQLSYTLQHAKTIRDAASVSPNHHRSFIEFTEALLEERTHPTEVAEFISSYNDQIHRRMIQLCLQQMKKEGYGSPPVEFCFIVMGSQGRKEQAFSSDQDNGLILDNYKHLDNWREVEDYFHRFAAKVNLSLVEAGFPECPGGIMARERRWCREIDEWKREVFRWVKESDAEEVRDFTIFIDYRPVYGDFNLAETLRDAITERIRKAGLLHAYLMKDTIRFRVPVNTFGRLTLKGKHKTIDLKKSALMQIVNGVRIFAIRYGIKEPGTAARLDQLEKMEVFHPRDVKNARLAMDVLLYHRLRRNIFQLKHDKPLSNELSPMELEKEDRRQLKEALIIAKRMQQMSELSFQRSKGI
ncbi:DUF294 nucleotidyltransferase-like domain-containing protein [Alkalicoccus luteus]|uniref:Cyclic nucleotide-binding domain-containing protein n=1 Tax=Alkalicoccus luteus TaxID=1237094 RepID=A0A969PPW7_9BACI|nr:DUF294 nucleotidyltransferase-like domain-containing protein [Alkalicoccus luteus]NJP37243.1 cyclic nucleotide-binding domain-containing protein [Alkalicoccus luteus]